jgi:protease I
MAESKKLYGRHIAILATDGVEQVELTSPQHALQAAGATVTVVSPQEGQIQGMEHHDKGQKIAVDAALAGARADQFDGLVLPGGVANPDTLRTNAQAVDFVRAFVSAGKPVAAICHGPWLLVEADAVRGKKVTSWPSLQTDLRNAGATWVDETVVRDGTLVTSRKPADLEAFNREMIGVFEQAAHRKAA